MSQEQDRTGTDQEAFPREFGPLVVIVPPETAPEPLAVITQHDWDVMQWRVWDTHRAITELEKVIRPAMESISSGKFSLAGMLLGKRG